MQFTDTRHQFISAACQKSTMRPVNALVGLPPESLSERIEALCASRTRKNDWIILARDRDA